MVAAVLLLIYKQHKLSSRVEEKLGTNIVCPGTFCAGDTVEITSVISIAFAPEKQWFSDESSRADEEFVNLLPHREAICSDFVSTTDKSLEPRRFGSPKARKHRGIPQSVVG